VLLFPRDVMQFNQAWLADGGVKLGEAMGHAIASQAAADA
jgi:hypothetical protein